MASQSRSKTSQSPKSSLPAKATASSPAKKSGKSSHSSKPNSKTVAPLKAPEKPLMSPEKYEEFDGEWRRIGLAAPARRALVDAKLFRVSDLRKISVSDLEELHGLGKSAIARLKVVMEAKKIKFRN